MIGANGAGKTSLLLALVGILPLSAGSIHIDGLVLQAGVQDKDVLKKLRVKTGLVFQNPEDQLFMPGIYEDLAFGPRNMGLGEDEVRRRVEAALTLLGIAQLRDRSSLKLSGGEQRLAALATVLTMEPDLMLFDEPTAFLDPRARRCLIRTLISLPHTKLIATHDIGFALEVCDRAVLLREGSVFAAGPITLLTDPDLMDRCGL